MDMGSYLLALILLTIAAAIVLINYRDLIWPVVVDRPIVKSFGSAAAQLQGAPARRRPRSMRSRRLNQFKQRSRHHEAKHTSVQRSQPEPERSEKQEDRQESQPENSIVLTPKELTQLAQAIQFKAAGQTEQASLEAAFQCTKGGSKAWKRAKQIYDMAMKEEPV